jgi:hypothetical protein
VNPTLITATIGDLSESLQQIRTYHRGCRKIVSSDQTRRRRAERSETRLGDDRMQQQRSPGGEKFVRGLLVLPGLPRLPGTTRRRSPNWYVSDQCQAPTAWPAAKYPGDFDLETTVLTFAYYRMDFPMQVKNVAGRI